MSDNNTTKPRKYADGDKLRIEITWAQFKDLSGLCYSDPDDPETARQFQAILAPILKRKGEKMDLRDLYSRATAGDEVARQQYLDRIGAHPDFRW